MISFCSAPKIGHGFGSGTGAWPLTEKKDQKEVLKTHIQKQYFVKKTAFSAFLADEQKNVFCPKIGYRFGSGAAP